MQTKTNVKSLWMGMLAASVTILIISYVYYNIMGGVEADGGFWFYKILYALVVGFGLSYLCWKTKRIGGSHLLTGLVIGVVVSVILLAVTQLTFYNTQEAFDCCNNGECWVWAAQMIIGTTVVAFTGKTGAGSDD